MKIIAVLTLIVLSFSTLAAPQEKWLAPLPASSGGWQDWVHIPSNAFFEVPANKLAAAEQRLSVEAFLPQEHSDFRYFNHPDFGCPASTRPYLVRAYTNGNTNGAFSLHWAGPDLIVSYGSLGGGNPPVKSALVACLSKSPSAVFSALSSAL
jgi:hypothetical protein